MEQTAPYPYTREWQDTVDHYSADWRAYLEARGKVKKFIQDELEAGREAAIQNWKSYCSLIGKTSQHTERLSRLVQDFKLIGVYEGEQIRLQLRQALEAGSTQI